MLLTVLSLCLVGTVGVTSGQQTCTQSSQCARGQCCRENGTNATIVFDPSGFRNELQEPRKGRCTCGGASPGEQCDSACQCGRGYSCYRAPTGVCCGNPGTCIEECEARKRRIFDSCFPPPVSPGGGGPGGNPTLSRRRRAIPSPENDRFICQKLLQNPNALDNLCKTRG